MTLTHSQLMDEFIKIEKSMMVITEFLNEFSVDTIDGALSVYMLGCARTKMENAASAHYSAKRTTLGFVREALVDA